MHAVGLMTAAPMEMLKVSMDTGWEKKYTFFTEGKHLILRGGESF
jgi:hypothetical protein